MKITCVLLCLATVPAAMGSEKLDSAYINVDNLIEKFGNSNSTSLTANVANREVVSESRSYALDTHSYTSIEALTFISNDIIANGVNRSLVNKTLTSNARLIASNGGDISLNNVRIDLTSYSDTMYAIEFETGKFTLDLSKIFTNDGAASGGSYSGNVLIKIGDANMRTLVHNLQTEFTSFIVKVGAHQTMNLSSLVLASNEVAIRFNFNANVGDATGGDRIPEPSTASLSLMALSFLLLRRRSRRRV